MAAQEAMSRGDLIPDDLVIRMIADEVLGPNATGGYVLDGFPRTVPQAIAAYDLARQYGITAHAVILLEIPYDELIDRLVTPRRSGRADRRQRRDDPPPDRGLPGADVAAGRLLPGSRHPAAGRRQRHHRRGDGGNQRGTRVTPAGGRDHPMMASGRVRMRSAISESGGPRGAIGRFVDEAEWMLPLYLADERRVDAVAEHRLHSRRQVGARRPEARSAVATPVVATTVGSTGRSSRAACRRSRWRRRDATARRRTRAPSRDPSLRWRRRAARGGPQGCRRPSGGCPGAGRWRRWRR